MRRDFCTYFDVGYLPRALALHASLARHAPGSRLFALCMDRGSEEALRALRPEGLQAIPLAELEADDPELAATKAGRERIEYYFTCSPCLPRHVLRRWADVEMVTYLDADLFFFASPEAIFDEIAGASIAMTEHRLEPALEKEHEPYGRYNVGWLTFRRDAPGQACLERWRGQCLAWCHDRVEDGRFGDQKYLDAWPSQFPGVHVIRHTGANVAPWNLGAHPVEFSNGRLTAGGAPLIFYHFHALRRIRRRVHDTGLREYGIEVTRTLADRLYRPYLETLRAQEARLARIGVAAPLAGLRGGEAPAPRRTIGAWVWYVRWLVKMIRSRQALVA